MTELFEVLPEIGDPEKPRMVFFFDEAHLLFKDISKAFLNKIEQVVKLIRSKGVGIYFITQSPKDVPDEVLSQLGNKIQHALRAYTPNEMKAIRAAAASFRVNPDFDTATVLQELGTGEALVSVLDEKGIPSIVKKCKILPPQSLMGPISDEEKQQEFKMSNLYLKYSQTTDPESAYEILERLGFEKEEALRRAKEEAEEAKRRAKEEAEEAKRKEKEEAAAAKQREKEEREAQREAEKAAEAKKRAAKSVGSTVAGTVGREVGKTVGGTIGGTFGKTLGGNLGASLGRGILNTLFGK
jgi:DNA helicase HerA-like ATPase